ncbi:MAG: MBL fold metallo-hydrolase [Geobacteraceae bacterium]|nr:MBL fold metallo-hydrolase [Geobacteraceae bacterium]
MKLQFVGSGDAFGHGNRFNTCFYLSTSGGGSLIDCGATSLIALKKQEIDPRSIETILITHFHADHFGGIPFLMLDAQFSKREAPLTIVGPPGLKDAFIAVMETAFPGSSSVRQKFSLNILELAPRELLAIGRLQLIPYPVNHGSPDGLNFYAYRISAENRVVTYTGDTEWTDELIEAGRDADLLIAEAYFFEKKIRGHLDLATLIEHLGLIQPKRLILTHMGRDMLERLPNLSFETAYDGKVVEI